MEKINEEGINKVKKWRDDEVYPVLKKYGLMPEDNSLKVQSSILVKISCIGIVCIIILLAYGIFGNSFKSDINQLVNVDPSINNTVKNEYDFKPETINQYDFEMPNITVNCPEQQCQCDCITT